MKLICEIQSIAQAQKYCLVSEIAGYLIGLPPYSLDAGIDFTTDDIEKIIKIGEQTSKMIILNMARLFHEDILEAAFSYAHQWLQSSCVYIQYSDLGLYQLLSEAGYRDRLIYDAPTYLTNLFDVKLYASINYRIIVSNQISIAELKDICHQSQTFLWIDAFGKSSCFYSKRQLLKNYFLFRNMPQPIGKTYSLQEEFRSEHYPIIEDATGTHVYEATHHCLLAELSQLTQVECCYLRSIFLSESQFTAVIDAYRAFLSGNSTVEDVLLRFEREAIVISQGAYQSKSILRKHEAGESNETN